MGQGVSALGIGALSVPTGFQSCLETVCAGRLDCVAYPDTLLYQELWVHRYNLAIEVEPIAVTRPLDAQEVSGFVKCAAQYGIKVQPKSGGHSYANYCVGGQDGELAIDLRYLQQFSMDTETWQATIGPATQLGDLDQKLHDNGNRAMSHGKCPSVALGGHAPIGGLGPSSRMWGSSLDHVLEVEVVTADGSIVRANQDQNSDLFWAIRGGGSGFGIVTEFVARTQPAPGSVVTYSTTIEFSKHVDLIDSLKMWQDLVADPNLDRRWSSEFTLQALGAAITATFYGTTEEYEASGIPQRLPHGTLNLTVDDFLGVLYHEAEQAALTLAATSTPFTASTLAFRRDQVLSDETITNLMNYLDNADRDTAVWFLIFDSTGGYIAEQPADSTSYPHRDKIFFAQGYGVGLPNITDTTRAFVQGMVKQMRNGTAEEMSAYAGYVDPALQNAQESYWGSYLPKLEQIKAKWDAGDVFHNPQSVRPAGAAAKLM